MKVREVVDEVNRPTNTGEFVLFYFRKELTLVSVFCCVSFFYCFDGR